VPAILHARKNGNGRRLPQELAARRSSCIPAKHHSFQTCLWCNLAKRHGGGDSVIHRTAISGHVEHMILKQQNQ